MRLPPIVASIILCGLGLAASSVSTSRLHAQSAPVRTTDVSTAAGVQAQAITLLEGCWQRRSAGGVVYESWQPTPQGLDGAAASFRGDARGNARGDTLRGWEFLRIGANTSAGAGAGAGVVSLVAAPNGQNVHAFPLVSWGSDSLYFSDPAHDFPQHIVYRRTSEDSFLARVWNGSSAAQVTELRFARIECTTPVGAPDARGISRTAGQLTRAVAIRQSLSQLLDSLRVLGRAPGLSAAVALPDGRVITVVSGIADSVGMVPLTPTHRLLAGSVGKTFFAALALDLVAKGRLPLDQKISRWLSDEPWFAQLPNGVDITVRQLMQHTSGLVRYEFQPEFARDLVADPLREWKVADQLSYILGDSAPFVAGTSWEYSDTNYLVLALIMERIIGGTAYDAIQRQFITPLRLRGTVPSVSTQLPLLANGYVGANDPLGLQGAMLVNGALKVNPRFEWAGGGYASTPEDLARWAQQWYQGQLFAPGALAEALNAVPARGLGPGARYGLGVIVRDSPRGVTYGHSGFFPGYLTEMRYYADSQFAVAVQANTSDGRAIGRSLSAIAHALAERAMDLSAVP